jgi:DNA-binding transcriptional LysR family regulator
VEGLCRIVHNLAMILDGVDVFVKVVQASGFSAAARQLNMPTTTVSAKIARLEARLGVTLLRRTTRRLSVTAEGEAYYRHCVEALKALGEGEEQLRSVRAEPMGTLRITAPPDLAQLLLPPLVLRYAATYPLVSIEMVVTNTPLDLIAQGIDLAIRASPMQDSTLTSRKFVSAPLALWAAPDYLKVRGVPRKPGDLARHDLLRHSRLASVSIRLSNGRKSFSVPAGGRVKADDMQTVRALAEGGGGIALLPLAGGMESPRLERVLPGYATEVGNVYFVFAAQRFVPVNVRSFIDMALHSVQAVAT